MMMTGPGRSPVASQQNCCNSLDLFIKVDTAIEQMTTTMAEKVTCERAKERAMNESRMNVECGCVCLCNRNNINGSGNSK